MQNEQPDIFRQENFGIETARDVLTMLWRMILRDTEHGPQRLNKKMNDFMHNPRTMQLMRGKSMSSLRGNMRKSLIKNGTMTFRWFERGIYMLAPKRATLSMHLEWYNGETTVHTVELNVASFNFEEEGEDDDS